jgi:hypothetical protein
MAAMEFLLWYDICLKHGERFGCQNRSKESDMRISKYLVSAILMVSFVITINCGGGGGSDSGSAGTGTLSVSMTDAKPLLPSGATNCFVTIDEVLVHSSGGGWESLPMIQTPYTIDLLQFTEGNVAEFVPPVTLPSGKYTQIRLSVFSAKIRFDNDPNNEIEIDIPSENLKTDKNFDFDMAENAAVDLTIDFDLSRSIVVESPAGNPSYELKPVLHLVETAEAATIEGFVANSSFIGSYVVISVLDGTGQEYTKVKVEKTASDSAGNPLTETSYAIFWLVPNQAYTVQINYNPGLDDDLGLAGILDGHDDSAAVPPAPSADFPDGSLTPGDIYSLDFPCTN